jgi:glycosyltransferase involved in cell wall biosynthesis
MKRALRTSRARAITGIVRFVRALAAALLRSRPRGGDPLTVRFVIANAYALGGTVRTTLSAAAALSGERPVELVSVMRHRDEPAFPLPAGVSLTVLDDRRPGRRRGAIERLARRAPGLLVARVDARMARHWTLWTDMRLVAWAWRARGGTIVTTRPGLNLLAPILHGGGVRVLGQEHLNRRVHRRPQLRAMEREYPQLDALVVLTQSDAEDHARALPAGPPVVVIPNGVTPPAQPTAGIDATEIVAAGRLTPQKGFDLLIDAFAAIAERHADWTLRIHGDGPERDALERRVDALGLSGRIALPGVAGDLESELRRAGIFVLSSRFEGLPMVLLEAMASGLAVAAFDCPSGPRDVIEHGHSGLLVPPRDVDALAGAIDLLIADAQMRRALGAAARERVAADFSVGAVTARWRALLDGNRDRARAPQRSGVA